MHISDLTETVSDEMIKTSEEMVNTMLINALNGLEESDYTINLLKNKNKKFEAFCQELSKECKVRMYKNKVYIDISINNEWNTEIFNKMVCLLKLGDQVIEAKTKEE